jgi:hypothetical protein
MMNKFIQALLVALVLGLLGERAYSAYLWKAHMEERARYAEVAAAYLFSPSEVKKDGKPLSRADLLDLLLTKALQNGQTPPTGGDASQ